MAPQSLLQAFQQELDKEKFHEGICRVEVGFFPTLGSSPQKPTKVEIIYLDVRNLNDLTSIVPDWEFNFEVWPIIKANIEFLSEGGCSSANGWSRIKIAPKG
jgi:hypothetical protein